MRYGVELMRCEATTRAAAATASLALVQKLEPAATAVCEHCPHGPNIDRISQGASYTRCEARQPITSR